MSYKLLKHWFSKFDLCFCTLFSWSPTTTADLQTNSSGYWNISWFIEDITACLVAWLLDPPYFSWSPNLKTKKFFWTCVLMPSPTLPSLSVTWIILSLGLCFHSCHNACCIVCDYGNESFCVYLQTFNGTWYLRDNTFILGCSICQGGTFLLIEDRT